MSSEAAVAEGAHTEDAPAARRGGPRLPRLWGAQTRFPCKNLSWRIWIEFAHPTKCRARFGSA